MRANQTHRYFSSRIVKLPHLSKKEKDILLERLKTVTLEKIGKNYGVTAERIRQIEKAALIKAKTRFHQQSLFK
jgi:DNA-directed RNA polymerase sigma subunit (sigma70/sigma32)